MRTLPIIEKLIPGLSVTSPVSFVESIELGGPIRLTVEFDANSTIKLNEINELDEVNGVYDNLEDVLNNSNSALRMALSIAFSGIVGKSAYNVISDSSLVLHEANRHMNKILNCGEHIDFSYDIIEQALEKIEIDESLIADSMSVIAPARLDPKGSIDLHILNLVKVGFTNEMINSIPIT